MKSESANSASHSSDKDGKSFSLAKDWDNAKKQTSMRSLRALEEERPKRLALNKEKIQAARRRLEARQERKEENSRRTRSRRERNPS